MAGTTRHLKTQNGRFYARVAVPKLLQSGIGKTELTEALGGDRRMALKNLPQAVARLQDRIDAEIALQDAPPRPVAVAPAHRLLSIEQLAVRSYKDRLLQDTASREATSAWANFEIDDGYAQNLRDGMAGRLRDAEMAELVGHRIEFFVHEGLTDVRPGTAQWRQLAMALCASEYEALSRVFERNTGDFTGQPVHPAIQSFDEPEPTPPVDLIKLWDQYVATRRQLGSMRDGGRRQMSAVKSLATHVRKPDANELTKKDILAWRDELLKSIAPQTIAKVYLPTIRSLFRRAVENDFMKSNPAEDVRQSAPKAHRSREASYTDAEAVLQLTASRSYQPKLSSKGKPLENEKVTAAKRWVPMLCAFTGARIAELTQLRREDVRREGTLWVIRINPDAGSVKTNQYRDVPLHSQIVSFGFINYVRTVDVGPLFHMSPTPARNQTHAQKMSNRLRDWLHEADLVPSGVQPWHAWRHRFKTVGLELGIAERILDAIQGHAPRRSSESYGNVTLKARHDAIALYPEYNLDPEHDGVAPMAQATDTATRADPDPPHGEREAADI